MTRPSQRREMAETAVARRGSSIALACRTFGVSETCYRYSPKLNDENEQIADLLIGLTKARKTWGFGLCFLYLRNVQGHGWNHRRYSAWISDQLSLLVNRPHMVQLHWRCADERHSGNAGWLARAGT